MGIKIVGGYVGNAGPLAVNKDLTRALMACALRQVSHVWTGPPGWSADFLRRNSRLPLRPLLFSFCGRPLRRQST
eukprot:1451207-Pyramimonas_sp.AAC.1